MDIKAVIEQAWEDRNLLKEKATVDAIDLVIEKLDKGKLRTAEIQNGNWVINGQKIWTSTAQYSQMMFCLVRTEPEAPKHAGISYILIPMDTPGTVSYTHLTLPTK